MANLPTGALSEPGLTPTPTLTVHSGGGPPSSIGLIGHAGLALDRLRGTPTAAHLEAALDLDLERLEVDLCHTADGALVLRHDVLVERANVARPELLLPAGEPAPGNPRRRHRIPERTAVAELTLAQLRRLDPEALTLDDAVAVLGRRLPLLLDLKVDSVAPALGRWLSRRRDTADFAVCTENLTALLEVRFRAPRAERWASFPDIGSGRREGIPRVIAELWRTHNRPHLVRRSLFELQHAVRDVRARPHHSMATLAGLPWRSRLPGELATSSREVGAAGLCVQHWLVTDELCDTAERLRLPMTAWTVNQPAVAARVAACGVDLITTDQVEVIRETLAVPPAPRLATARR